MFLIFLIFQLCSVFNQYIIQQNIPYITIPQIKKWQYKKSQVSQVPFPSKQSAIASLSGIGYVKYTQLQSYKKRVQQLNKTNGLQKYLFNASQDSSYFTDQIMTGFEQNFNLSHIQKYKSTLLKFVEGKTLQTCAGANRTLKFYSPGTDLTLIDWSPKMVSIGSNKSLPTIKYKYVIGDVTKMPFVDNQFDTVVDIFGLQHVLYPQKALHQIRRVCKKNGNILLMNQGLSDILQFHYWQNAMSAKNLCNMAMFSNRNWEKLVKSMDFQIVHEERKKNGKLYIYILKNKKDQDILTPVGNQVQNQAK